MAEKRSGEKSKRRTIVLVGAPNAFTSNLKGSLLAWKFKVHNRPDVPETLGADFDRDAIYLVRAAIYEPQSFQWINRLVRNNLITVVVAAGVLAAVANKAKENGADFCIHGNASDLRPLKTFLDENGFIKPNKMEEREEEVKEPEVRPENVHRLFPREVKV